MTRQRHEVIRKKRVVKQRCRCKDGAAMKCTDMSNNERWNICNQFWQLIWKEKKSKITSLVRVIQPQRTHNREADEYSRRCRTLQYHLNHNSKCVRVCKQFFLNWEKMQFIIGNYRFRSNKSHFF